MTESVTMRDGSALPREATVVPVFGGNLGDILWTTPLARYVPNLTVWLRAGDAKAEATGAILDGTCARILQTNPPETPKAPIRAHVTQQILTHYGHGGKPSIPRVILTSEEVNWALRWVADNNLNVARTVAMVTHTSGWRDPSNYRAHYVRGQSDPYRSIASFWRGAGYRVVQFGPATDYYSTDIVEPLDGALLVRGLSVRELAAVYHVIGKLISCDTGDQHLMLAVGGKVAMLTPPPSNQMGYRHWDLHYDAICWGDERPRIRYILHGDWTRTLSTRLFSDL